jgi:hypothetical protein
MMKRKILFTLFVVAVGTQILSADEKKVALIIGNFSYRHVSSLSNPKNDSMDMAESLRELSW